MAHLVTLKILVDESNESAVYDGINEILRDAQYGGPNGEDRGWVVDWKFDSVEPANESLNDSIANETYAEGDAFNDRLTSSPGEMHAGFEPFKLVVEARATSEFMEGPEYAEITVTTGFIENLFRLSRLCDEHGLESVTVPMSPDMWDQEGELRIRGGSLRVWGGEFWFEAWPKNRDYGVETVPVSIADLATVATLGTDGAGFRRVGDKVFFADSDEGLKSLIAIVEPDTVCSECGMQVGRVIGCPDGTEVCQACFDAGHR
ncbi:hypothetical protein [Burkholderia multivorans]|uniref:hypothetical protein n=1 Tax=Burkholderia multivorans TaxID=87883 RepID=UPI001C24CE98|nr:hypothetical protein [Burkholderia multivorans]MBU9211666.1 hypothetical protein [Burkholderia multivorans]